MAAALILAGLAAGLAGPPATAKAELVDRILVVAAGKAITWSAALADASCQAFLTGQPPIHLAMNDSGAEEKLRPAIERLTDQLIIEEVRRRSQLALDSPEAVAERVEGIWKQLQSPYSSPDDLRRALQNYSLDEATLRSRLAREQRILTFVDFSLRPQIRIESEQIAAYYQDEFLPQFTLDQPGAEAPALDEVREKIEEILVQREMNQQMGPWLESLRKEQGIRQLPR